MRVKRSWRQPLSIGTAALALALFAWWGWPVPQGSPPIVGSPAPTASQPSAAPSAGPSPWEQLARASSNADASRPKLGGDDEASLRRFEADWCASRGAALAEALKAIRPSQAEPLLGLDEHDQNSILAAQTALSRHARTQLRQLGDARSLALADWLQLPDADAAARSASARLRSAAQTSQDPLLLALALQGACDSARCSEDLAARWMQVEPDNLWPLLKLGPQGNGDAWLNRLLQTSRADTQRAVAFEPWLALPLPAQRGLLEGILRVQQHGLSAAWGLTDVSALTELCIDAPASRAARCMRLAELLWSASDESPSLAAVALRIAGQHPALRAAWPARAERLEAALLFAEREAAKLELATARQLACVASEDDRARIKGLLIAGEWRRLQNDLDHSGEDPAALALQYRQRIGRSLLDRQPR